ncbi:MAG TPA: SHOCT domain-containing protein [Propionibacteriaceae bacterium]|nr:SHOCT domain-containing protein [Propionibacteriaceae bacterium]
MGLIGGMARTAVVAGTATAVSNRVSRRQANRWAERDQQTQDAADAEAYRQQQYNQQQGYSQYPPQQGYPPQQAYAPPPQQAAAPAQEDMITQLQKLGELKAAGVLTEEEFAAQKAKILGS